MLASGGLLLTMLPELLGWGAAGIGPLQAAALGLAMTAGLIAWGLGRIDGRWLLLATCLGGSVSAIAFCVGWSGSDLSGLIWTARQRVAGPERLGIYQMDDRLGWRHQPNSHTTHTHLDFVADYSIDAQGHRTLPRVAQPQGSIILMGCSFTFGHGVNDAETFAARLAADQWRLWQVENVAVSGYGASQAYLILEDRLPVEPPPRLVLYGWLGTHAQRNERRRTWLELLDLFGRRNPLIRWPDGQPPQVALIGPRDGVDDSPTLRTAELEQSVCLLTEMYHLCAARRVAFACLLLANQPSDQDPVTDQLVTRLAEQQVPVIDARSVHGSYYEHDGHPRADWHAATAAFLAADPFIQKALADRPTAATSSDTRGGPD
jgi:hypothetical protein